MSGATAGVGEPGEKMRQEKERTRDRPQYAPSAWALVLALLWAGLGRVQATWGQDSARGELRIEGTHVTKLFLYGGDSPHPEELSDPCSSVSLPVGTYRLQRIELQDGYVCWAGELAGSDPVVIKENSSAVLRVGAPLVHGITAARRGRALLLRYELRGIGGEKYTPVNHDSPPQFTLSKDRRVIASGQFDYG